MDYETLKNCPHCGGTACLHSNFSHKARRYFVFAKCDICGAQGKIFQCVDEPAAADWNNNACIDAVKAWNMRTYES